MKACTLTLLAFLTVASVTFGRIGDTPAQFKDRYGEPTAESFDQEGYGICVYGSAEFKEIRVTFAAEKSQLENTQSRTESQIKKRCLRRCWRKTVKSTLTSRPPEDN